jgi:hypothetical protein
MSVANSQPVRRSAAPSMHASSPAQRPVARAGARGIGFAPKDSDGEGAFKVNLSDLEIPRAHDQLDVEGFKPSLLSRLFDLFSR